MDDQSSPHILPDKAAPTPFTSTLALASAGAAGGAGSALGRLRMSIAGGGIAFRLDLTVAGPTTFRYTGDTQNTNNNR